ncbi:hypothetical protein JZ785_06820 [Alicyclobacillus curvatus]|jgi:hypothetical protein|nr:hypothetical protein JZ785_06820 [Alicyclobacillus curvatus]
MRCESARPELRMAFGQPHAAVREIMDGGWETIVSVESQDEESGDGTE